MKTLKIFKKLFFNKMEPMNLKFFKIKKKANNLIKAKKKINKISIIK